MEKKSMKNKRYPLLFLSPFIFVKKAKAFFVQELKETRLDYMSLDPLAKKEIKKERLRHFASLSVSLALHIFLLLGMWNGLFSPSSFLGETKLQAEEVDFELTEGMVSSEVQPLYDPFGEVIIKPSLLFRERKKDKHALLLNELLKNLKKEKGPVLSSSVLKSGQKNFSRLRKAEQNLRWGLRVEKLKIPKRQKKSLQQAGFWSQMGLLKKEDKVSGLGAVNNTEMMKVIDSHSFQFRDCYEKALLKDESLSIRAMVLLKLNQSRVEHTKLELKGRGNPVSRRLLSHCLFRQSKTLVFAKNRQNISIRFNLIFGL